MAKASHRTASAAETTTLPAALLLAELDAFARWGYNVHGWFKSPTELEARSGVLIVSTMASGMEVLVDVQPTKDVLATYHRLADSACWRKHAAGGLRLAAIYLDQAGEEGRSLTPFLQEFLRDNAAAHIRSLEQPLCGE